MKITLMFLGACLCLLVVALGIRGGQGGTPAAVAPSSARSQRPVDVQREPLSPKSSESRTERTVEARPASARRPTTLELLLESSLVGRVVTPDGTAVTEARVVAVLGNQGSLTAFGDQPGVIWHREVRTDAEGRFQIDRVPAGYRELSLGVESPGFAPVDFRGPSLEVAGTTDLGDITMREGSLVRGRVVDEVGRPVAGAQVSVAEGGEVLYLAHLPSLSSSRSAADGSFAIGPRSEDALRLRASLEGYVSAWSDPVATTDDNVIHSLTLERARTLVGSVTREPDGQGVVARLAFSSRQGLRQLLVETTPDGRFELGGFRYGSLYIYSLSAEGYERGGGSNVITIDETSLAQGLHLSVREVVPRLLRVVDAVTSKGIAGAELADLPGWSGRWSPRAPSSLVFAHTDADGLYRGTSTLWDVSWGERLTVVQASGYAPAQVWLPAVSTSDQDGPLRVELHPLPRLVVETLPGAEVTVHRALDRRTSSWTLGPANPDVRPVGRATADERGRAVLEDYIACPEYLFVARSPGLSGWVAHRHGSEVEETVSVPMMANATLIGRVSARGGAVLDHVVLLVHPGGLVKGTVTTADGGYELTEVIPGDYRLVLMPIPDRLGGRLSVNVEVNARELDELGSPVSLGPGQTVRVNLEGLQPAVRVNGELRINGIAAPNRLIGITRDQECQTTARTDPVKVITGAAGEFECDLPPGSWRFDLRTRELLLGRHEVEIEPGFNRPVHLDFEASRVTVMTTDPAGSPMETWNLLRISGETESGGRRVRGHFQMSGAWKYTLAEVPPGRYELSDHDSAVEFELRPGDDREVSIALPPR